jgi:hypothetical protein
MWPVFLSFLCQTGPAASNAEPSLAATPPLDSFITPKHQWLTSVKGFQQRSQQYHTHVHA